MVRSLTDEVEEALSEERGSNREFRFSVAKGELIYPVIKSLTDKVCSYYPNISVTVYPIRNDFFGERITVTGLLTGEDITAQLRGKDLGERLFLPDTLLRFGTETLLDDMTVPMISDALQVPVSIVKSDGYSFVKMFEVI